MQPIALHPPIVHLPRGQLPVLLSVPHSGRAYPDWLVALASHGRPSLQALEDPLVDRLAWRALGQGIGAVIAQAPRAAVDCNRAEDEIDPAILQVYRSGRVSARARGGLGIVPSRTAGHGRLWRRPLSAAELEQRLEEAYRPYHRAIEAQLGHLLDRFGCALLLDCHSMPTSRQSPAVVFGDRYGRSAAPWLMTEAITIARGAGFDAGANDPFAGGQIVEKHGSPGNDVHALQIEIDRGCYLEPSGTPNARFNQVAELIEALARGLGSALLERRMPEAAE